MAPPIIKTKTVSIIDSLEHFYQPVGPEISGNVHLSSISKPNVFHFSHPTGLKVDYFW